MLFSISYSFNIIPYKSFSSIPSIISSSSSLSYSTLPSYSSSLIPSSSSYSSSLSLPSSSSSLNKSTKLYVYIEIATKKDENPQSILKRFKKACALNGHLHLLKIKKHFENNHDKKMRQIKYKKLQNKYNYIKKLKEKEYMMKNGEYIYDT